MTYCRIMSACLLALSTIVGVVHATAPHPRVRQMIKQGILPEPYYLKHLHELRARGVNAPWAAPELLQKRAMALTPPARSLGPALVPTGTYNALVILVDFSDKAQQVQPAFFDSLVFSITGVSAWDYYQAVSYGNLDIVTVDLPSAVGWVRVDSAYTYYVNGQNGFGVYPQNAQKLVEEAVRAVDDSVDFSKYDNDGNGEVDALFVVHAGPGAEFTGSDDDIWSHAFWLAIPMPVTGGVSISRYSIVPEYWDLDDDDVFDPGEDMTIGVYAHEMGHSVFGLPDLYDRDEESPSNGLGAWSLMAGGSWNGTLGDSPALPDAWSHAQMGYVQPVNVTADSIDQTIVSIETTPDIYRLWTGGAVGNQYFLVENRQQIGYDTALPGSGLLIYHVDESVTSQNDNEWYPGHTSYGHYLVALEQADGLWDLERAWNYGDDGDPYPGYWNNTTFDFSSAPSSQSYSGQVTRVAVANISVSDSVMVADFRLLQPVAPPTIRAINDFPGDQGRVVTIEWLPSANENGAEPPVLSYGIWLLDVADTSTAGWESIYLEDGWWFKVGVVNSLGDTLYTFTAPTFVDSNETGLNLSYFRISAHAKDSLLTSFSAPASGYSVDNSAIAATEAPGTALPGTYALHPNYPNPFNPTTTLRFDLPRLTRVSIIVYDLRGREVVHLVDELMEPGYHQVVWNGRDRSRRDMPTGIYIARLVTPEFTKSIKMVLLK